MPPARLPDQPRPGRPPRSTIAVESSQKRAAVECAQTRDELLARAISLQAKLRARHNQVRQRHRVEQALVEQRAWPVGDRSGSTNFCPFARGRRHARLGTRRRAAWLVGRLALATLAIFGGARLGLLETQRARENGFPVGSDGTCGWRRCYDRWYVSLRFEREGRVSAVPSKKQASCRVANQTYFENGGALGDLDKVSSRRKVRQICHGWQVRRAPIRAQNSQ